jgi:hypothetical protein
MDAVEDYARRWIKREVDQDPELEFLSDCNAVSVAIGDNGNRLIFEIWWNFFYDLFSIKMLLMLIASIPLLANGIWRNFLLLS